MKKLTIELLDEISKQAIENAVKESELKSFMAIYYSMVATSHIAEVEKLLIEKGFIKISK